MFLFSIVLFLSGIYSFFIKKRFVTLLTIIILSSNYWGYVEPNFSLFSFSIQHSDLALLLIFCLFPFRILKTDLELKHIKRALILFLVFLLIAILYDYFERGTTFMQIFRTTRKSGYLLMFFLLKSFKYSDYIKTIKFIIFLTIIQSLLYVSQYVFGYSLINGGNKLNELGESRYGSFPEYIIPCLAITIFFLKKKSVKVLTILFILTIILYQSRGAIISTISMLFVFLYLKNKIKISSVIKISFFATMIFLIISSYFPIILERFMNLQNEIFTINQMNYNSLNDFFHEGSFTFRLGLTYERFIYVIEEPVRILLGVGFIPDMDILSPIFVLGTHSESLPTGFEQFNSIDILFPNIITRYGIFGSIIFINLLFKIINLGYTNKKIITGQILFTYLFSMIFISLINESFYNSEYFIIIFILIGLIISQKKKYNQKYNIAL